MKAKESSEQSNRHLPFRDASFTHTHWSWVLAAGQANTPEADEALSNLCQRYWYPLFVYVRRLGYRPEDAADLVQGFFAKVVEKNYLKTADPLKGRFRSFLLVMLGRFVANEWDRSRRQKRGGGMQALSIDVEATETQYSSEPTDPMTPERAFDRRWALLLLARVLERLEQEFIAAGKARVFEELKVFLTNEKSETSRADICEKLQMTETNLKVSVHRLRRRYRELLRAEISETVDSPEAIDDEIRCLFAALG